MNDHRPLQGDSNTVILFDGVCNLCNGWVDFVIDRDAAARFKFAALQSESAVELLRPFQPVAVTVGSIMVIEGGSLHFKSDAILLIMKHLRSPWPLVAAFVWLPHSIRDRIYDFVAKHRYSWFGRTDSCRVATPELADRFL